MKVDDWGCDWTQMGRGSENCAAAPSQSMEEDSVFAMGGVISVTCASINGFESESQSSGVSILISVSSVTMRSFEHVPGCISLPTLAKVVSIISGPSIPTSASIPIPSTSTTGLTTSTLVKALSNSLGSQTSNGLT